MTMYTVNCDVCIVGGGPAGLAAAVAAGKNGAGEVLIIERDVALGGILQQCIHPGFGLKRFHEELTGPEYYGRFVNEARKLGVKAMFEAMVLEVRPDKKEVVCTSRQYGLTCVRAGAVVLAMGCRERTRANITVPGTRPAGLYTAGAAQYLVNRKNLMVGKRIVILGSGDIGMIMARRMTLEGAKVVMVAEIMDYLAGLTRNRVQCLEDFDIPLRLGHTITRIVGDKRVEGVYVAPVDENRLPILEKEEFVPCDTVLFSVGLIPENELTRAAAIEIDRVTNGPVVDQHMQTSAEGVFACGNVVHVNDLADNVSAESEIAGASAALYTLGNAKTAKRTLTVKAGDGVRYVCPQRLVISEKNEKVTLFFRVAAPAADVSLAARTGDTVLCARKAVRVNPGEMESLTVETAAIGEDLTVTAKKEG